MRTYGYGRDTVPTEYQKYAIKIGSKVDLLSHVIVSRLFDAHGIGSKMATRKFLKWADEYNPDELWLHNIHGYYINYPMLFEWIKKRPNMKVKWTFHDCWAFTGHCSHFLEEECKKWESQCRKCPQKKEYPSSFIDQSKRNFKMKQKSFTYKESNFKRDIHVEGKLLILGGASAWIRKKGLFDFLSLESYWMRLMQLCW